MSDALTKAQLYVRRPEVRAKNLERNRRRRERLAAERGRPIREYRPQGGMSDAARRARKLENKVRYRMMAAEREGKEFRPRGPKTRYDAHVRCFHRWRRLPVVLHEAHVQCFLGLFHDAHVVRYFYCLKNRDEYQDRYRKDPEAERARSRRRKATLPDSLIAEHYLHLPLGKCPSELIEAKRTHLQFVRMLRERKKE